MELSYNHRSKEEPDTRDEKGNTDCCVIVIHFTKSRDFAALTDLRYERQSREKRDTIEDVK